MNALQTQRFIVKGAIYLPDRQPLVAVTIKAFDKDLRQEELLGETVTNTDGYYEISYTSVQFTKTEKDTADLFIRVYTPDKILLATSDIRFNAKTEETIDLTVDPEKAPKPSEFEILMVNLTPVLGEVQLTELTEEDAIFLIGELGELLSRLLRLTPEFFRSLHQAAENAIQTGLPIEVFYAFMRANLPLELDQLLQRTSAELRQALLNALDSNIIPAKLRDTLNQIMERIEQLKVERGVLVQRQFTGQLLNQSSGNSLADFSVQTFDLDAGTDPKDLGSDITNSKGLFVVTYFIPANSLSGTTSSNRRFHLIISNPKSEAITETDLQVPINQEQVVEIRVAVPEIPEPSSPVVEELATTLNLEIPQELRSFLAERRLGTLADIRNAGGLSNLEGLPVAVDSPIVRTLDAHANLNTLTTDFQLNAALIDRGYSSTVAIATAPRTNFVSTAHETLGDFKAAQLQVISRAQTQFLNNVLTGLQADSANGFSPLIAIPNLLPDEDCRCRDCEAAVSPAAYLADLLDYALNHLKNNNSLIDLQFLTDTFHQLFGDLPTSCSSVEKQVRQVRICVEVLRHYLKASPPAQPTTLEQAEKQYLIKTYTTLLNQIGTSYEELRLIRTAPDDERQALAKRLGFSLSDRQSPGDELDRLFLDPTTITELTLEKIFGLADTTRNPLAEGVKLGDSQGQIPRWNLSGIAWGKNTDAEGTVYINLRKSSIAALWLVDVYRDLQRTDIVASGLSSSSHGTVQLVPENNSNLSGTIELDYKADSSGIEIANIPNVIPDLLSWRLRQLRSLWQAGDAAQNSPIIDPDLINLGDLKNPAINDPAYDLWQSRHTWVEERLTNLQTAPKTLEGLASIVQSTLTLTPQEPLTLNRLIDLDTQRQQGINITSTLEQLNLSLSAFNYLLRIRNLLAQSVPILDSEWSDIYSILVNVQKRRRFADWKIEEGDRNLTLSQDYFQIPSPDFTQFPPPPLPELPAWRTTQAERRNWQATLQTRIEQEKTVINALSDAISKTEEETLPELRDALILATNVTGNSLEAKAKSLIDLLLIDTRTSGCQTTTRTAQAIETLQTAIFSIRTGQLRDTYPNLILDADNFDEEWKWIGSYSTWRAALLVFLYPENILLPSLRKWQTPAFRNLVESLRSNSRLTPEQACQAAKAYADYFQDVCTLTLEASCQTLTRIYKGNSCRDRYATDYRSLFYMFARGSKTNTVYWSAYDSTDESGYAQTFWEAIPGLINALSIIGAVPYQKAVGERYIYLFARVQKDGVEKLVVTKYNLEQRLWDSEPEELDIPENAAKFTAAIEQRDDESIRPHLAICIGNSKIFSRRLKEDGSNWEADLPLTDPQIEASAYRSPIEAVHALSSFYFKRYGLFFLIVERRNGRVDVGQWSPVNVPISEAWSGLGPGIWGGLILGDRQDYVFMRSGTGTRYGDLYAFLNSGNLPFTNLSGVRKVATHCGKLNEQARRLIAYQATINQFGGYKSFFTQTVNAQLQESSRVRVAPLSTIFNIPEQIPENKRQFRRFLIQLVFTDNADTSRSNLTYLEEAYYFVPVHLALQLQSRGQYLAALDWFRTVYDYSVPVPQRKIYYGLKQEESIQTTYERAADWLLDPLNPHSIASTRANTYTRFTLLSLIRCFLEFADAEFTRDTSESLPRARTLYLTALELLDLPELRQQLNRCEEFIISLDITIDEPEWTPVWDGIKADLISIGDFQHLRTVADELRQILATSEPVEIRLAQARSLVDRTRATLPIPPNQAQVVARKANQLAQAHIKLLAQPAIIKAVQKVGQLASQDYVRSVSVVSGLSLTSLETEKVELPWLRQPIETAAIENDLTRDGARTLANASSRIATLTNVAIAVPIRAVEIVQKINGYFPNVPSFSFCIPPNPIVEALRLRTELNLYKLRTCRNIAGVERQTDPYAAPTYVESGPQIGTGGQIILPGTITFQPTPYRYPVIIERAKQLVQLAAQMESALLSALEKRDAEYFNLLKARQDLGLARAGVRLQDLRVKEAEDGVKLAELQQERTRIQEDFYDGLIEEGLIGFEQAALSSLVVAAALQTTAAVIYGTGAVIETVKLIVSLGFWGSPGEQAAQGFSALASAASTTASIFQTLASFERREEEWKFQLKLAQQDIRIGSQQIRIAEDQVRIIGQERTIAMMQADNAEEVVNFLTNKFTNVELYDWMSNILERVYSFFLQQATAMAKLAENQLAFERQQIPSIFIQADYWEAPTDTQVGDTNGNTPDRRGLTGSARLLQDIFQLDQYAFDTNKRKLQLTKIISLAQLAPAEFQRFRETGLMLFATPMELFDRDFPGHYLRLIKRVRTSVIALIPPTQGIHATLTTTSISRVVVGGEGFQTVVVRRDPESVALSSPNNATGLFELEPQSEFLFPFESIGVDTAWEFQMPKAANLFDYNTIADVLIAIEYTALNSFEYRQQIIQQLNQSISADRPFSFRNQFADQWYDLNNSELTATPMVVRFQTTREDFPPNVGRLKIQQIVLYFVRMAGKSFEVPVTYLRFTEQGDQASVGGGATSIEGVISTRRGNAGSWISMIGKAPFGEWELALPNTEEMKNRFKNEEIEDILFVVTYSGQTPA